MTSNPTHVYHPIYLELGRFGFCCIVLSVTAQTRKVVKWIVS